MSFTPRTTNNPNIKNLTFYRYIYPYVAFNIPLPNCTTYAYGRTMELCIENGAKWTDIRHYSNPYWWNLQCVYGNAETWYASAKKANHWQVGSKPKLGAIACWSGDNLKKGGHVGIVEKIEGDYVTISQSNYKGQLFQVEKVKLVVGQKTSFNGVVDFLIE